jgi:hypothetical protein
MSRKPARASTVATLAAAAALALGATVPAHAADTLDFWNGASASGQCGTPTLMGSQKIDNPLLSGIQQAGTIQKYKRTCSYPTSANQVCWNTRAIRVDSSDVAKAGITWIGQDSTVQYWLQDSGTGWVSSPLICEHQVDGLSWGAWSAVSGLTAILYT